MASEPTRKPITMAEARKLAVDGLERAERLRGEGAQREADQQAAIEGVAPASPTGEPKPDDFQEVAPGLFVGPRSASALPAETPTDEAGLDVHELAELAAKCERETQVFLGFRNVERAASIRRVLARLSSLEAENARLAAELASAIRVSKAEHEHRTFAEEANARLREDAARLDWLEKRIEADERVEICFTDAWVEHGEFGSILSSGPMEFWLRDNGVECGPTLRDALDAARSRPSLPETTDG